MENGRLVALLGRPNRLLSDIVCEHEDAYFGTHALADIELGYVALVCNDGGCMEVKSFSLLNQGWGTIFDIPVVPVKSWKSWKA